MKEGTRKYLFFTIVVLLALLLIAVVILIYDARIKNIEKKQSEGYNTWKSPHGVPGSFEDEIHLNIHSFL